MTFRILTTTATAALLAFGATAYAQEIDADIMPDADTMQMDDVDMDMDMEMTPSADYDAMIGMPATTSDGEVVGVADGFATTADGSTFVTVTLDEAMGFGTPRIAVPFDPEMSQDGVMLGATRADIDTSIAASMDGMDMDDGTMMDDDAMDDTMMDDDMMDDDMMEDGTMTDN